MNNLISTEGWAKNFNNLLGFLQTGSYVEKIGNLTTPAVLLALLAVYTTSRVVSFFGNLKVSPSF
jgi:hypothetical protein